MKFSQNYKSGHVVTRPPTLLHAQRQRKGALSPLCVTSIAGAHESVVAQKRLGKGASNDYVVLPYLITHNTDQQLKVAMHVASFSTHYGKIPI